MCYASSLFDLFNRVQAVQGFLLVFRGFGVQVGVAAQQHCCLSRLSLGCDQDDHGMTRRHQEVVTGSRVLPSTPLMPLKTNCDMVTAAFFGHQPIY